MRTAFENYYIDDGIVHIPFPDIAVLYLRGSGNEKIESSRIKVDFPKSSTDYDMKVLRLKRYSIDELFEKKMKFQGNSYVISNGVTPFFHKIDVKKPERFKDKFVVCMSGRLADEKRQDLIIKAVAKSKYNDKIQVVLCGQGPNYDHYLALAKRKKLANPLEIKFCSHEELRETMNYIDLYIHASDYEIEGISAMEAISCGAVPLISDHPICATKDFAIDKEHCLFKHGSPTDLMKKIDWFYEHPEELNRLKDVYHESAANFALDKSVDALEQMFFDAIKDQKEGKDLLCW